jgi:hypothetical protein
MVGMKWHDFVIPLQLLHSPYIPRRLKAGTTNKGTLEIETHSDAHGVRKS